MKILFLDVDGVLNHYAWRHRDEFPSYDPRLIDPDAIKHLRHVLDATGARVVVSSSWRLHYRGAELRGFFWGFGIEVVGATPEIDLTRRGEEISAWLREPPVIVDSYAVVDDYDDAGIGHRNRFVLTDDADGLTPRDAERLIRILGRTA